MDDFFMKKVIATMRRGVAVGQSPFGAVITKNNKIISAAHNTVLLSGDPTGHAEMNAIRKAAKKLKSFAGTTIYSTCEPCPMCFVAIHWAGIPRLVFGARIRDAAKLGFRELPLSVFSLNRFAKIKILQTGREEVLKTMAGWRGRVY